MEPGNTPGGGDLDVLLEALEQADGALRALYGKLSEDPDLRDDFAAEIEGLSARRLDLARRVGFAVLARRRVPAPPPVVAAPADGEGTIDAPAAEPPSPEPPSPELRPDEGTPHLVAASDAQLAQWKSAVRTAGLGAYRSDGPSGASAWPLVLHELMEGLGAPRALGADVGVIEETDALDAVGSPDRQAQWARLPRSAQQVWLSMLVARTRALKELPSASEGTQARVKEIIARYPPWAKAHSPGHVNGMQAKHAPLHGTWADDARAAWSALEGLLGEERVALPCHPAPPAKKAKRPPIEGADDDVVDPAWDLLPVVRGRSAILLGGDPREPNRERLERSLQLESLEWPPIDGPRKVEAIVGRVRRGAYGLVMVLQPFVAHKEADPIIDAAKAAEIPWALVEGYGVNAVKLGLERFLGGRRPG